MGAKRALINFIDHNLNDIKRKPHMKFGEGAWVVKLPHHYVIGNTKDATECFIGAHGGNVGENYFIDNTSFTVPTGCHVTFYQPHGHCFQMNNNFLRTGAPMQDASEGDVEFPAGSSCTNYLLSKFEGRHGVSGGQDAWESEGTTYQAMQQIAQDAGVVMVTIRNRWSAANVSLKDTIAAVRKLAPNITHFHCLFCRVDEADSDWSWAADEGRWYE